jgi:hypothetical protein
MQRKLVFVQADEKASQGCETFQGKLIIRSTTGALCGALFRWNALPAPAGVPFLRKPADRYGAIHKGAASRRLFTGESQRQTCSVGLGRYNALL